MLPERQAGRWNAFYNAARHNTILDEKTTILLHLASAMAVACQP